MKFGAPIPTCACPRCLVTIRPGDPLCATCGFSFEEVDQLYGEEDVHLDRLMDSAHCLTVVDKDEIDTALDAFERRYPQLFFAVYLDALPTRTVLEEFAFWLLNRAAVDGIGPTRPNDNGILLCIDLNARKACLVPGYLPERLLGPATLRKALHATKPDLLQGDYTHGILGVIDHIDVALRKEALQLSKHGQQTGAAVAQPLPDSLRSVRSGSSRGLPKPRPRETSSSE